VALAVLGVALTAVVVGVPGDTADSVSRAAAHDQAAVLLNKVVLPAGAVRLTRAPTALMDSPDRAGSTTVVRLSRFWTVPAGTALEVQHALGALQPIDLHPDGRSYAGGPRPEQEVYGLRYAAAPEAVVVLYAALVSPRVVGVRADVEATYHPLRSRRERVPDSDTTALVEVVDGQLPQPLSSISLRGRTPGGWPTWSTPCRSPLKKECTTVRASPRSTGGSRSPARVRLWCSPTGAVPV